jgi:tungstate transport system substrate-binding protein
MRALWLVALLLMPFAGAAQTTQAGTQHPKQEIILASTTSTQNSGLLDAILPVFFASTGITVKVVAVGTGQALRIARNGDADVLLVHHRASEDAFVAQGFGIERRDVMYNDFVIVGPKTDPAGIRGMQVASEALQAIARSRQSFISRGDDSGTHKRELALWAATGTKPEGAWYREIGAGMGAALNMASATDAYVLTDRGTWITFGNKGDLQLLMSGDKALFNPYGVILVNPALHPYAKINLARQFSDWLVSEPGQSAIGAFQIDGVQAFCPNFKQQAAQQDNFEKCPADFARN